MTMIRILFFGDVVGRLGRKLLSRNLPRIKTDRKADVVIANGENAAGGAGLDLRTADELWRAGVDVLTTGNHIWNRKEIFPYLEHKSDKLIRPLNYPEGAPGKGSTVWTLPSGQRLLIANAAGRVFMPDLVDDPFRALRKLFDDNPGVLSLVDFHAEATSEKCALAAYLDGTASAVLGTHTHIQTADNRVLPGGTAYISDVGMCGPLDGVIGVRADEVVERFVTGRPNRFSPAKGRGLINAVLIEIDEQMKKAVSIERVYEEHAGAAGDDGE